MGYVLPVLVLLSDAVATIFSLPVVWLLFEGGVYFFGKPADIDNSTKHIQAIQ